MCNGGGRMSSNYTPIPIINRMASILNRVLASSCGVGTGELLRSESIPKTTLYRLLKSMVDNEFLLYLPESGVYTIGPKFTASYVALDERVSRLRDTAMPFLQQLADQVQETIKLTVLSGMQSYTVTSVEGSRPLRISIDTGAVFPLHAGASGKVLMSSLTRPAIERYYAQFGIRYTDTTIMSIEAMERELSQIRTCGYAVDNGEYMSEIKAVAAPVCDAARQIIAAVSITYPSSNQEHIDMEQLVSQVMLTARKIGEAAASKEIWENPARLVNRGF